MVGKGTSVLGIGSVVGIIVVSSRNKVGDRNMTVGRNMVDWSVVGTWSAAWIWLLVEKWSLVRTWSGMGWWGGGDGELEIWRTKKYFWLTTSVIDGKNCVLKVNWSPSKQITQSYKNRVLTLKMPRYFLKFDQSKSPRGSFRFPTPAQLTFSLLSLKRLNEFLEIYILVE